jgi:hypothetical protein
MLVVLFFLSNRIRDDALSHASCFWHHKAEDLCTKVLRQRHRPYDYQRVLGQCKKPLRPRAEP